jgi:hypothetical protein
MKHKNDQNQQLNENNLYIRRCHICDAVTESETQVVDRCGQCHKAFAPFVFCETAYSHQLSELSAHVFKTAHLGLKSVYPPLMGIALYW